jgi:hypothetical protein
VLAPCWLGRFFFDFNHQGDLPMSSNIANEENDLVAAKKLYSRLSDGAVLCQLHIALEGIIESCFDESLESYVHSDAIARESHVFNCFVFIEELLGGTDITTDLCVNSYIENLR